MVGIDLTHQLPFRSLEFACPQQGQVVNAWAVAQNKARRIWTTVDEANSLSDNYFRF
jgi:hypothetical protein